MDWYYYNIIRQCIINVYDDGNQIYENKYDNSWEILATNNKGKFRIRNIKNPELIIGSISCWKVEILNI